MNRKIYLDNVSTTSLNDDVKNTYIDLLDKYYCNSDALYDEGITIFNMQEKSRFLIASLLNVKKDEIIFTSGSSEANSLAIKGLCLNKQNKRKHIITSIYEHSSVYNSFKQLEEEFGFNVTYLLPNNKGLIEPNDVKKHLTNDTLLVSIMQVNNEIGVINNIDEIKKIVKNNPGTYFHCDITQAIGKINVDLNGIDLASFSAHKIHGLKGSGALIKKEYVNLIPLISGGQQEFNIRGGTSNSLVNIILAKTLRIALENMNFFSNKTKELNEYLVNRIADKEYIKINSNENCIKSLINISTPIPSEVMLNALNLKGVMVSSKSTCSSKEKGLNRTLNSLNIDENYAIRISFDTNNTYEDIDFLIDVIEDTVNKYGRN